MTTIVLGAQWGDEGKGKLIDILSASADLCARCQGGNNAGHTIVAGGVRYDFHMLPSGLLHAHSMNLLGSGVVVHVPSFFGELDELARKGALRRDNNRDDNDRDNRANDADAAAAARIRISDRAHVVFDLHQLVDGLEEVALGTGLLGTTKKGIGPAYSSKASRSGVRVAEVFDEAVFERRLRALADGYRRRYGELLQYDVEDEIARFKVCGKCLPPSFPRGIHFFFSSLFLPKKKKPASRLFLLRRRRRREKIGKGGEMGYFYCYYYFLVPGF
jgi:adenylosuccinate synthase